MAYIRERFSIYGSTVLLEMRDFTEDLVREMKYDDDDDECVVLLIELI